MTAQPTTTYPATADGLAAALAALGTTAEQVAETLAAAGLNGQRHDEVSCPIAWYLRDAIPTAEDAYAGISKPRGDGPLYAGIRLVDARKWVDIEMPAGPAAFVEAFDGGNFDELALDWDDSNARPYTLDWEFSDRH
jgi:hypothetical protein